MFRDLSLRATDGAFIQIMGPNGCGKSSLLRVLAGLIAPEAGFIAWQGKKVAEDPEVYRASLHYIGHLDAVKPELTGREMLDWWGALRGRTVRMESLDAFGIAPLLDRPIRRLSAGQKRRLSLTRLVLDDAPLWLLDEPTTALDCDGTALLMSEIARHRTAGGMVIAATHEEMFVTDGQKISLGPSFASASSPSFLGEAGH